jgi:anti-sigma B factor antagonist
MRISDHSEGFLAVVSVSGELDAATTPELRERLYALLDEGAAWLLLDMRNLEYIDSEGLGLLIGVARRAGEAGGDLAVVCTRPNVLRVFDISGTRELLNLRQAEEQARELLGERRSRAITAQEAGESHEPGKQ